MITLGMIGGFVIGVVICAIVVFFMWRNNKKKFVETLLDIDNVVSKYDTPEEIKAKVEELIAILKAKYKVE
jgi:hypothetical protein